MSQWKYVVYRQSLLFTVAAVCQMFEEVTRENSQLQSQLQDTQRTITQTRLDLEKATQVTW